MKETTPEARGPLRPREAKAAKALHKTAPVGLPGCVCEQWTRCGKAGCRCARGELHGPYYCRMWREQGRLRKSYVPAADVERVRAQCERERMRKRRERRKRQASWSQLRELRTLLREAERLFQR